MSDEKWKMENGKYRVKNENDIGRIFFQLIRLERMLRDLFVYLRAEFDLRTVTKIMVIPW